jgi:hypothetical protein
LTTGTTPGVGAKMLQFLEPDEASENTTVAIGDGCDVVTVDADLSTATPLVDLPPQPASELARPTVLTKSGRDEFLIAVQGLGPAGRTQPIVEYRVRARFVPGKTTVVPIFLGRSCAQKTCGERADQTCIGDKSAGACGCGPIPDASQPVVTDPGDVAGSFSPQSCDDAPLVCDGGIADAGASDAGASDGGVCPAPCTPSPMKGSTCSLVSQCGCATNLACVVKFGAGEIRTAECSSEKGTRLKGQTCSNADTCAPGLGCIGGGKVAVCRAYCETAADCGTAGVACIDVIGDSNKPLGYKYCAQSCRTNSECETACCTSSGACAPPEYCEEPESDAAIPSCSTSGQSCTAGGDCCAAAPWCLANPDGKSGTCGTNINTVGLCTAATGDTACGTCIKTSCCTAYTACRSNRSCQAYSNCRVRCGETDATCIAACGRAESVGATLYTAYTTCSEASCGTQCGD